MNLQIPRFRTGIFFLSFLIFSLPAFSQKGKKSDKLEKRKFAIEIREVTPEGKKYDKDVFEFTSKEIICDYFETKFKFQTLHYKTEKDSSYTEDGDPLKYFLIKASEKGQKADEEWQFEGEVKGKEISGKIILMKGDKPKRTWEFEGTQNN